MSSLVRLFNVMIFVVVASCSTTSSLPRFDAMLLETTGQNGRACVRSNDIDGYGVLKHNLVSIDGGRKYYLATLLPGCQSMETSMSALFAGGYGEVCGGGGDKIVTREDNCHIHHMYEFESREDAFKVYDELIAKRKEMSKTAEDSKP